MIMYTKKKNTSKSTSLHVQKIRIKDERAFTIAFEHEFDKFLSTSFQFARDILISTRKFFVFIFSCTCRKGT